MNAIRFGLAGIKGVGEQAAVKILEEREANGPFKDFADFTARVDARALNKRVLEHLVKTGAFDFSGAARKQLFDSIDAPSPGPRPTPATRPPASTRSSTRSPRTRRSQPEMEAVPRPRIVPQWEHRPHDHRERLYRGGTPAVRKGTARLLRLRPSAQRLCRGLPRRSAPTPKSRFCSRATASNSASAAS